MSLKDINFGDVDAKNELLKQQRLGSDEFFDGFSIPQGIDVGEVIEGRKFFILGLKGTGKTALLRYCNKIISDKGETAQIILFKSDFSEEDKQALSKSAGYDVVAKGKETVFLQDFKEAWKWLIYEKIATLLKQNNETNEYAVQLQKLTGVSKSVLVSSLSNFFSKIKSGKIDISADAVGVAVKLGIDIESTQNGGKSNLSDLNRACSYLVNNMKAITPTYLLFDELELFHEDQTQFDRDRRILRDLIFAISSLNADSSQNGVPIFVISTLRTEVLSSVLELGHEINKDIDDFGVRIDWSNGKSSLNHPLMLLIRKKIGTSLKIEEKDVWRTVFPEKINNQAFEKFILNQSYYRPRDIVRLLRIARDFRSGDEKFTTAHFEETSTRYSQETWVEVTEELLAKYSSTDVSNIHKLFLGFKTNFFINEIEDRIRDRHGSDSDIAKMVRKYSLSNILDDLYRIGVIGNNFKNGGKFRHLWIFRGNSKLNDSERMTFHKSVRKHLALT